MTTATRLPSSGTPPKLHGGPAGETGRGLPKDRGEEAEDEADDGADEHRVAAAAGGHLDGRGPGEDLASFDELRGREELLVLRLLRHDLGALLLGEADL